MSMVSPKGETRHLMVDDTDERIEYSGSNWIQDYGDGPILGNYGKVFNSSHHYTSSAGASLSFKFQGSSIALYGTIENERNKSIPTWECYLDDDPTPFAETYFPDLSLNNMRLCQHPTVPSDSIRTVTLKVTGTGDSPFRFDSLQYNPVFQEDFSDGVSLLHRNDSIVEPDYGFQLSRPSGAQLVANATRAQVSLDFNGTSVTLFGKTLKDSPNYPPSLSWSIDKEDPTNFSIPTWNTGDSFWQAFFTTTPRQQGPHHLEVFYDGNTTTAPLIIEAFAVFNGTRLPAGQSLSRHSSSRVPGDGPNIPAIVGGVVGGLFLCALLVLAAVLWRRRRHVQESAILQEQDASRLVVNPFPVGRESPTAMILPPGKEGKPSVFQERYNPPQDLPPAYHEAANTNGNMTNFSARTSVFVLNPERN